jgi:U3 small nucleolar RNA-associated protein 7
MSKVPDRDQWFIPEDKDRYEKYLRGADDEDPAESRTFQLQRELAHHRSDVTKAARAAFRSELLQTTAPGQIDSSAQLSQKEILKQIPVAVAARKFDFELPDGPYTIDITLNGRSILLGGSRGHFASFDWYSGNKFFELHPETEVKAVSFLYDDTLCAMATQRSVYIHDKNGVQIHELLDHVRPVHLAFLRQHWLLVSASETGRLTYTDVTDGKTVAQFKTRKGTATCMCANRHNGIICLGHTNGVASFWSPNSPEPAATVFVHPSAVTAIDVNFAGTKFVTAGCDGSVRVWDIRNFERVYSRLNDQYVATDVAFSATGVLGTARGSRLEFFKSLDEKRPFLAHNFNSVIKRLKFVTFDDFAVCGLENGISSVVVPGSGEPNIDSDVANPFATPQLRQEQEVRGLLDKIPWDMITMEEGGAIRVGRPKDQQKERAQSLKKHRMVAEPSPKPSGTKSKRVSMEQKLQMMKEEYHKQKIEEKMKKLEAEKNGDLPEQPQGPLARFAKARRP